MVKEFAKSTRKNAKRGYIKEMDGGMFFAMAHDKYNDARDTKMCNSYEMAERFMRARGFVVEL